MNGVPVLDATRFEPSGVNCTFVTLLLMEVAGVEYCVPNAVFVHCHALKLIVWLVSAAKTILSAFGFIAKALVLAPNKDAGLENLVPNPVFVHDHAAKNGLYEPLSAILSCFGDHPTCRLEEASEDGLDCFVPKPNELHLYT